MNRLEGKATIVTGAANGIGARTSHLLAAEGAHLVLADVDEEGGEEVRDAIREEGGTAVFEAADVTQTGDVRGMIQRAVDEYGSLDVLVNNAGTEGEEAPVEDQPEENFDHVISVNMKGVWLGMKYGVDAMLDHGGGSIVNIASIVGEVGFAGLSPYSGSKHGVVGMTKSVALECADKGIRVNAVAPGVVRTEMTERYMQERPDMRDELMSAEPMPGMTEPEEVARGILFLASEESSRTTGETLRVEGGYLAR